MKKPAQFPVAACLFAAIALTACGSDNDAVSAGGGSPTGSGAMFALTASNKLVSFDASNPGAVTTVAITGLGNGDDPVGLDFRTHDDGSGAGQLYLITNNAGAGKIYRMTPSGTATFVANLTRSDTSPLVLDGTHFAMDFSSESDRLRLLGVGGTALQNVNVNPTTGVVAVDEEITGTTPPRIAAIAYTNSIAKASSSTLKTTLFGIDAEDNRLVRIGADPATDGACPADVGNPKCGVASDAGSAFTATVDVADNVSFDIDGGTGLGYAAMNASGAGSSTLYTVNLNTGAIAAVGTIGGGETIKGLTLATLYVADVYAVTETNKLFHFRPGNPHDPNTPGTISGLPVGVNVLGIDFRPDDGKLYALGSDGFLYTVDTDTRAATKVGTSTEPPTLVGPAFGVDFSASSDRLRVVSEAEENLRFNPDTGNDNPPDPAVAPAGEIVAIAMNRNFVNATGVTKYGIDTAANTLVEVEESSTNNGQVTLIGPLGVDPASTCAAFDIAGGRDGLVLAALDIGGDSVLHTIDLATGAATVIGSGTIAVGEKVCSLSIQLTKDAS